MNYKFVSSVVVEATSEEDALNKIAGRIGAITRHLADGAKLHACDPFFTLASNTKGEATDMAADPIVAARAKKLAKE